jgi:hypothetical protein
VAQELNWMITSMKQHLFIDRSSIIADQSSIIACSLELGRAHSSSWGFEIGHIAVAALALCAEKLGEACEGDSTIA